MDGEQLKAYCLGKPWAYADRPLGDIDPAQFQERFFDSELLFSGSAIQNCAMVGGSNRGFLVF